MFEIRAYRPSDKDAVMDLIELNIPAYFAPAERADLSRYLDDERELYYVVLFDGSPVACGGINFAENGTVGKISWDIVHPAHQGKSLGTRLLRYRIEKLKSRSNVRRITVRTSQQAYGFYQKQGFVLKKVEKDYWAEGFDLYDMEYEGV